MLALPLERFEVERVIASAYRHFQLLLPVAISTRPKARGLAKKVSDKTPVATASSYGSL